MQILGRYFFAVTRVAATSIGVPISKELILSLRLYVIFILLTSFSTTAYSNTKCSDTELIKFNWSWCSENDAKEFPVVASCFGFVTYTDILYKAVQIKIKNRDGSFNYECLFSNGSWNNVNLVNCPRGIEREYMTAFGPRLKTKITECWQDDSISHILGKTVSGRNFSSSPDVSN